MNKLQAAEQFRRAVQLFANSLGESQAREVASIYPAWKAGQSYQAGQYLTHGVDQNGDPKLYKAAQAHTSRAEWEPGADTESLYTAISLDADGYPIWCAPTGAHDAYDTGDIVSYGGVLYVSRRDGNTSEPGMDEWWDIYDR